MSCDFIIPFPTRHNYPMTKLKVSIAGELGMVQATAAAEGQLVSENSSPLLKSRSGHLTLSFNISKALAAGVGSLTLVN
jgi:hypothetical protein